MPWKIRCDDTKKRRQSREEITKRMRGRSGAMNEQTNRPLSAVLYVPTKPRRLDETAVRPVGPISAFARPIRSPQTAHEIPY